MGKKRKKWLLSTKIDKQAKASLIGFLTGPYTVAEMTGRSPKIPPNYPTPKQLDALSIPELQELKTQLQEFLKQTGGPDLTPEEKRMLSEAMSSGRMTLGVRRAK